MNGAGRDTATARLLIGNEMLRRRSACGGARMVGFLTLYGWASDGISGTLWAFTHSGGLHNRMVSLLDVLK